MIDVLEQDQEDFGARLSADPFFAEITVLIQRKGVTENDIEVALSVLNEKATKIGALAIVIMPELKTEASQAPAARFKVRVSVQVIEQPLFNLGAGGTGKSAEQIATRVRQLLHSFSAGRSNTFTFDGMDPIPVDGKISYGVAFERLGGDEAYPRVATPDISPKSGAAPQTVTITCATSGAAIYYTLDGSYPASGNAAAILYTAPINIATGATLRAAGEKLGELQQSNIAQATFV